MSGRQLLGWSAGELAPRRRCLLVPLPTYSPELNPVERVWLFLRERHLSQRLLDDYDAIVEALCRAWNALTKARLRSLTSYSYLEQVRI